MLPYRNKGQIIILFYQDKRYTMKAVKTDE